MSIGIYAFLRIYFLSFGLSAFAQFRTHCPPSSAAAVPIAQRAQRPGVCVCAWRGLPCCLYCAGRPGALGCWGLRRRGIQGALGVGWVDSLRRKKSKKAFLLKWWRFTTPLFPAQITPTPIANLKNFPQKQKDPYKGSVFCAILVLQALKGRNLQ